MNTSDYKQQKKQLKKHKQKTCFSSHVGTLCASTWPMYCEYKAHVLGVQKLCTRSTKPMYSRPYFIPIIEGKTCIWAEKTSWSLQKVQIK